MNLKVDDWVKISCCDHSLFHKDSKSVKVFVGKIKSIFNAFDHNGDNWIIEVKSKNGEWFLYKPNIDGGTIIKIKES